MKIKTSRYLRELAEAERRGYKRGVRETEDKQWERRRLDERDEAEEKFRARILRTLEEHERKFMALGAEQEATELAPKEDRGRCENAAVCNKAE